MNEFIPQDQTPQPADQAPQDQIPNGEQAPHEQAPHEEPPRHEQPSSHYQPPFDQRSYGDMPLHRPYSGRMIAGVAAGISQYLGVDVTIVRIVLAVLTVVGGAGLPVYVAGWLLIPDEGSDQSLASEFISSLQSRPS